MIIKVHSDITEIEADVIVNAANTEMSHGGGVARAIARAAGEELIRESKKIGFVNLGEFAVTDAGNLAAKKIIHIPTIDYTEQNEAITYDELSQVWEQVLDYCVEKGYESIATPLLGTGVVGLDRDRVIKILTEVAGKFDKLQVKIVEYQ